MPYRGLTLQALSSRHPKRSKAALFPEPAFLQHAECTLDFLPRFAALCFSLAALGAGPVFAADPNAFLDFSAPSLPGRLYVPPDAATSPEPRPFILFLHGAGETGTNNTAQVNGNIDNLFDEAIARGAFLYAPQAVTRNWSDVARSTAVMDKIDEAIAAYNIDTDRLYVTGLSMGGGGVWNVYNRHADRFAAAAPIAAVSPSGDFNPNNLVGKPSWAFHARNDGVVPTTASRGVVDDVLAAAGGAGLFYPETRDGQTTFRYTNQLAGLNFTEFGGGGHGIWGPVYDTPELYEWMFSKELAAPTTVDPLPGLIVDTDNFRPLLPIAGLDGNAIQNGEGFVAIGGISLSDAEVAATNGVTLSELADAFTPFGASIPMGINGAGGVFSANIAAPLASDSPLIGESVYLVVGDGRDIGSSEALFVFKSDQVFAAASPSTVVSFSLSDGQVLLGEEGQVFANRLGGFRDGIIGANVTIPEPACGVVLVLALAITRSRPARQDG